MTMHITITKLLAQQDKTRVNDDGEDELEYWKRVTARGIAEENGSTHHFELILDRRAGLLTVGPRKDQPSGNAQRIAEAIVREMGAFVARPIGHLVIPAESPDPASRSEWIVTNADHVSGLLHRVKEQKRFSARKATPTPAHLRGMVESLVNDVIANLRAVERIFNDHDNLDRSEVLVVETTAWDVHRESYLQESDDMRQKERLARFFERVRQLGRFWDIAIQGARERPDYSAAAPGHLIGLAGSAMRELRRARDDVRRWGREIAREYGTPNQKVEAK
ncbi:MAG TPA: hypothetical protein VM889_13425 [Candidatus Thermoplasmatota archaeon]|nr:hypothetical protein [Candidatus Thermoplasmatota archaeon]